MANRAVPATHQAPLNPAWLLTTFDSNWDSPVIAHNDSSLGQVNGIPIDVGSANVYSITSLPFGVPSAYQDGMTVVWIPANTNTASSTLTVSPLGAVAVLNPAGNALLGGELAANRPVMTVYKSAAPTGFRIIGPCPLNKIAGSLSGTTTIDCAGVTSITAGLTWTAAGTATVTLNHLGQGVPINITVINGTGSAFAFLLTATDPAGTSFTTVNAVPGSTGVGNAFTNLLSGGITVNNGLGVKLSGAASGPGTLYLSF